MRADKDLLQLSAVPRTLDFTSPDADLQLLARISQRRSVRLPPSLKLRRTLAKVVRRTKPVRLKPDTTQKRKPVWCTFSNGRFGRHPSAPTLVR